MFVLKFKLLFVSSGQFLPQYESWLVNTCILQNPLLKITLEVFFKIEEIANL